MTASSSSPLPDPDLPSGDPFGGDPLGLGPWKSDSEASPESEPSGPTGPEPTEPDPERGPLPALEQELPPWHVAMRAALDEGAAAFRAGDVPIGAVVVDEAGLVIGRGHNVREAEHDPTGHAEVVALRAAALRRESWRLTGCTLVVTVEPCTMCAGAAVLSRVDRVVFGAFDPKAGAVGSLWDVVRDRRLNHRPEVVFGVLAEDAIALLSAFFAKHRS